MQEADQLEYYCEQQPFPKTKLRDLKRRVLARYKESNDLFGETADLEKRMGTSHGNHERAYECACERAYECAWDGRTRARGWTRVHAMRAPYAHTADAVA